LEGVTGQGERTGSFRHEMKRWLIAIILGIPLVLLGYEASNVLYISLTIRGTARSSLQRVVTEKDLQRIRLPAPPHVWPDTVVFIKSILVKKAIELKIPVGEEDIAIWHDNMRLYCRIAWYQELTVLTFSLGSILRDFTEEVPIK